MLRSLGSALVVVTLLLTAMCVLGPAATAENLSDMGGCVMCPDSPSTCPGDSVNQYQTCMSCSDEDCVEYGCYCSENSDTPCGSEYPDYHTVSYSCYWM